MANLFRWSQAGVSAFTVDGVQYEVEPHTGIFDAPTVTDNLAAYLKSAGVQRITEAEATELRRSASMMADLEAESAESRKPGAKEKPKQA